MLIKNYIKIFNLIVFITAISIFIFILTVKKNFNYDLNKYIDQRDPKNEFMLNPKDSICRPNSNTSVLLLTFVAIAPHLFDKRMLIRNTWGNKNLTQDMRLIFAVGRSKNETVNKMIIDESNLFNDIIQKNFTDSYYNLTTKIMMSFKWISKYCQNSKYVLRINDDVVVNTFSLIDYLKSIQYRQNQIFGWVVYNAWVKRDMNSKFFIPYSVFNHSYYDTYAEGSTYILTSELASVFYNKSLNFYVPIFSDWLEDILIGMFAKQHNSTFNQIWLKYVPHTQYGDYSKQDKLKMLLDKGVNNTIFIYEDKEFKLFWNEIVERLHPSF